MTGATAADIFILLLAMASLVASALVGQEGFSRRLLSVVAVLFGASLVVSGMLRIVPGDPIESILGEQAPQDARTALSLELGLTNAKGERVGFVAQYGRFTRGMAAAGLLTLVPDESIAAAKKAIDDDSASKKSEDQEKAIQAPSTTERAIAALHAAETKSYRTRLPIRSVIGARLPYTAWLAFCSMLIAILLGVSLGVFAAWRKGTWVDGVAMGFAVVGVAIPRPALGPVLLLVFALGLRWFPVSGAESLSSVVLPALSLGTALAAVLARLTRASLLEVLGEDFVRTARAKGLSEKVVVFKHALRCALIPVLTIIGLQLGAVLAGAVITERIFVWPGIGLLLLESIRQLDVPIVQGTVLTIAFGYVLANLLTDIAYRVVDPRLRGREEA